MTPAAGAISPRGRMRSYQVRTAASAVTVNRFQLLIFENAAAKRPGCDAHHTISVRDVEYLGLWDLGAPNQGATVESAHSRG